jgi:hypothetical protein
VFRRQLRFVPSVSGLLRVSEACGIAEGDWVRRVMMAQPLTKMRGDVMGPDPFASLLATGGLFAWTDWTVKLVKFDTNQSTKWVIRVMQKISVLALSIFHVCYLEKEIGSWRGNP